MGDKTTKKGGGRSISIANTAEYTLMVKWLQKQVTLKEEEWLDGWTKNSKHNFIRKSKHFILFDDGKEGPWPHGAVLHVEKRAKSGIPESHRLYVPTWHSEAVIRQFHSSRYTATEGEAAKSTRGHWGRVKTYNLIRERHYGITERDIQQFVDKCAECQSWKPLSQPPPPEPIVTSYTLERVVCDLVDLSCYSKHNDGYHYIWTATDHFSSFKWAAPFKTKEASHVIKIASRLWSEFGPPKILHCDNGGEFVAEALSQVIYYLIFLI